MTKSTAPPTSPKPVLVVLSLWFVAALVVGALELLAESPLPPPAIIFGLTSLVVFFLVFVPGAYSRVSSLGWAPLVAFHSLRIAAGAYFLVLHGRGVLAGQFAVAAGWGDLVAGVGALLVLWLCLPARSSLQRVGLFVWNVLGLCDLLFALYNGLRIFPVDSEFFAAFTMLPLALLPLFVVPILLVSHGLIFLWLAQERAIGSFGG